VELPADRLPPYPLGEITELVVKARLSGRDIVDFSQMNPDLGAPAVAVDKAIQSLLLPHHHRYASSQGMTRLRSAFCGFYRDRFDVELQPDTQCVVTMGVKEGLGHAMLSLFQAGDQVVLLTPSYPVHSAAVLLSGARYLPLSLYPDWEEAEGTGYQLTEESENFFGRLENLFEHAWPRPKGIVLSFPHNPTGSTVTQGFFDRLAEFCRRYESLLLHDFAHAEMFFDRSSSPSLLNSTIDGALEFYSFSKSFQMPGWRLGFALGDARLVSALKRVKSYLDFGTFQPVQLAAVAVLEHAVPALDEYRDVYRSRSELLSQGLRELGWKICEQRVCSFIWAGIPERLDAICSQGLARRLIEEFGVVVSPGEGFDPAADRFMRFTLGESEPRIREGLRRMSKL
jgi:alanine-synthesizing transaminase